MWTKALSFQEEGEDKAIKIEEKLTQVWSSHLGKKRCVLQLLSTAVPGDWNAKVVSQETPGVTGKFGLGIQNEAGQRLIEFCQENALVIANTLFQQHKRRLYTWTSPDGQHRNQIDYILCSQRCRSSIQSAKTRPGADCGSDHELLIAKFRLKLKKVGKTTRPFRQSARSGTRMRAFPFGAS
ncbi:craniofacial development protein 2-like isoform X2 [Bubalus kerabau]|uniref:craniofacial development protein 2-like isoform X2 n=1 Tax=Bubalus carabanensis TaxID=3119969 RepID=UPI00244E70E4|nr:craniofacial development protein 2-like isoform X2 [Bubalus carabanensis]